MLIQRTILPLVLFAFCFGNTILSASNAQGADKAPTITQTVQLYEGVLSFPPPVWLGSKTLGDLKTLRNQKKNSFALEQIPNDQKIESWTKIYGIYGWLLPEYDMNRFVNESFNALALGCSESPKTMLVSNTDNSVIMTYHCGNLVEPLVANGNNVESGFLYMSRVDQSFAKVYLAWRGKKKDMKTDKWPINNRTIKASIEAMSKIRYFKAE